MENEILGIIAALLECGADELDWERPFKDIPGWSSLLQLMLVSDIEELFRVEIPMEDIPDIRSPRYLLEYLKGRGAGKEL